MSEGSNKQKHLEFIQGVISRMGGNLFYLRGWSITLIAGLLALASNKNTWNMFISVVLCMVTILFWIYDGYFLSQERKYRKLYDKVRKMYEDQIDFSMDTREFSVYKDTSIINCMLSKTLAPFYICLLIASLYLIISKGIM